MKYWAKLANGDYQIHRLIEQGADEDTIEKSENTATKAVLEAYLQDLAREDEARADEKPKESQ